MLLRSKTTPWNRSPKTFRRHTGRQLPPPTHLSLIAVFPFQTFLRAASFELIFPQEIAHNNDGFFSLSLMTSLRIYQSPRTTWLYTAMTSQKASNVFYMHEHSKAFSKLVFYPAWIKRGFTTLIWNIQIKVIAIKRSSTWGKQAIYKRARAVNLGQAEVFRLIFTTRFNFTFFFWRWQELTRFRA